MKKLSLMATTLVAVFAAVFALTAFDIGVVHAQKPDKSITVIREYVQDYHCIDVGPCLKDKCDEGEVSVLYRCYGGYWYEHIYKDGVFQYTLLVSRTPFLGSSCECYPSIDPTPDDPDDI